MNNTRVTKRWTMILFLVLLGFISPAQKNSDQINQESPSVNNDRKVPGSELGTTLFLELGGKGELFSFNTDFRLFKSHRLGFGITFTSYEVNDTTEGNVWEHREYFSPGFMYYYLVGKKKSFLEIGTGLSVPLNYEYDYRYTPLLVHAVIGYRLQLKKGFLFRAGFTPRYQPGGDFTAWIGISLGYGW